MAAGVYSAKDVSHITHFDGTNFSFWKFQLLLAVENHGLEEILNGTEAMPAPAAQDAAQAVRMARAAEIKAWKTKDVACRNYIVSTIDEKNQRSIMECKTASQMWNRLKARYEQATTSNRHLLLHKFMSYEYEENNDIMSHVSTIISLASQLKDIGLDISDEQVITRVIMTLPPSYRQFVTSWNSKEDDKKTVDRLTSDLLQEEIFRKMSGASISNDESTDKAFFTSRKKGSRVTPSVTSAARPPHKNEPKSDSAEKQANKKAQCGFCCRAGRKSSHGEDVCWRKEAYLEGKRDATKEIAAKESSAKIASSEKEEDVDEEDYAFQSSSALEKHADDLWYIDSGASSHMTDQDQLFTSFQSIKKGERMVKGVGGCLLPATGIGDIRAKAEADGKQVNITLKKVLLVPGIGNNLLSVGAAADQGIQAVFNAKGVKLVCISNGKTVATGTRKNQKLYQMNIKSVTMKTEQGLRTCSSDSLKLWHQRLGHVNHDRIKQMVRIEAVNGLHFEETKECLFCESCIKGKQHILPFPSGRVRATRIGGLVHSDVAGPMRTPTSKGSLYFVTFRDDYSGYTTTVFMKKKSEVFTHFKVYAAKVKTKTGRNIEILRSDNGGEYESNECTSWLKENGIIHQTSAPRTPQQNGVSERYNRTVVESARSMLLSTSLGPHFWAEATACATYILNRTLTSSVKDKTPYEVWYGRKPNLSHIRIFGCDAHVHVAKEGRSKFESKSVKCQLVGYCEDQKAFRLWNSEKKKIIISRDVIFHECITKPEAHLNQNIDPLSAKGGRIGEGGGGTNHGW